MTPRARSRGDRSGDPLDGLVNLFDLGIVLAVAFLLAALSSLQLTETLFAKGAGQPAPIVPPTGEVRALELTPNEVTGTGRPIGQVYELPDGRRVYVESP